MGALYPIAAISFLAPSVALSSGWPKEAFQATELSDAMQLLLGETSPTEQADRIRVEAPDLADDGAMVRVKVMTDLPDIDSLTIFSPKNPVPLIANFKFTSKVKGVIGTRIKMAATGDIVAVVKSGGKFYSGRKRVKVTLGGCA